MAEPSIRTGRRPLVVIPARFSASASALRYRAEVAAQRVIESVYAAGAEPLVVHPSVPEGITETELDDRVRARLWLADGVLLPGGGDLSPRWAGQEVHATQYDVDETQDAFDLAVARVALADGLPLLSICRGTQVVNVARGGDLVQDLTESLGADHRHKVHDIELTKDSPLRWSASGGTMRISCYHHQGIARLGAGLEASAYADDGTVEAVTLAGHHGWYLGVQWHPEDTADTDPHQAAVFGAFVRAVARRRVTTASTSADAG